MLDVKEVESHIPNPYLSNILQVQREGWGKSSMYKLKSSQQIYSIQASQNERLVGKSLRVSLPFFWFRTCSQGISKTMESINSSVEAVEHSSSDIT